jgi:hypothetical protein
MVVDTVFVAYIAMLRLLMSAIPKCRHGDSGLFFTLGRCDQSECPCLLGASSCILKSWQHQCLWQALCYLINRLNYHPNGFYCCRWICTINNRFGSRIIKSTSFNTPARHPLQTTCRTTKLISIIIRVW